VTTYIVDASVAAKWFLPRKQEPLADEAGEILRDYAGGIVQLLVPDLFWPEIGNILWKAARSGRISNSSAAESLDLMQKFNLNTSPCEPLLKEAVAIALALDRTVYDAIYVALAVVSNAPLITADERLANALAARFPVRWLGALR
jgi:predicted nucleic acid-binding protein